MQRPIVVVSERLGAVTSEEARLEARGAVVRSAPMWTLDEIARQSDARLIIVGAVEPFDAAALETLPGCVAVIRRGVGVDNVDVEAATRLGIVVANVPDASVEEVSDHALALLLALERRIVDLDLAVHAGSWERDLRRITAIRVGTRRLSDLTLGVVGLGRIGQALARKARPIYGQIIAADPALDQSLVDGLGISLVDLEELLRRADHISLHVGLSTNTVHLIDAAALRAMRSGAILVNTSRGGLVDQQALAEFMSGDHHLGGVGLDVNEYEPIDSDDQLLALPRVVLTAHSAASSTKATPELARRSVDVALELLDGRRPDSIVNPAVLDATNLRDVLLAPTNDSA